MKIPGLQPRRLLLFIAAWATVSVIFAAVQATIELDPDKPTLFLFFANGIHFGIWALTLPFLAAAVRKFPLQRGEVVRHALVLLPLSFVVAFAVSILYPAVVYWTWFPIRGHFTSYGSVLQKGVVLFLQTDLLTCALIICALHAWRLWRAYQSEQLRASELEGRLANAHLEALRMQLHPHFLFNTLHSIAGLVSQDSEAARRMIVALGDFLRLTLEDRAVPMRSLGDELEFIRLYIAIEKMRLSNRMTVEYDIQAEAANAMLPYLILQPLVENAVRHGIARVARPSAILLRAHKLDGDLRITVENDGPQRSCTFTPGVGISNTLERLRLHYGGGFQFELANRSEGGCLAILTIPFRTSDEDRSPDVPDGQPDLAYSHR